MKEKLRFGCIVISQREMELDGLYDFRNGFIPLFEVLFKHYSNKSRMFYRVICFFKLFFLLCFIFPISQRASLSLIWPS